MAASKLKTSKTSAAPKPLKAVGEWKAAKKFKYVDRSVVRKQVCECVLDDGHSLFLDENKGIVAVGQWKKLAIVSTESGKSRDVSFGAGHVEVLGGCGDLLFVHANSQEQHSTLESVSLKTGKVVASVPITGTEYASASFHSACVLDDGRMVALITESAHGQGKLVARVVDLRTAKASMVDFVAPDLFAVGRIFFHNGKLFIIHEGKSANTTHIDTARLVGKQLELLTRSSFVTSRPITAIEPVGSGLVIALGKDVAHFPDLTQAQATPTTLAPTSLHWVSGVHSLGGASVLVSGSDKRGQRQLPILLDLAAQQAVATRDGAVVGSVADKAEFQGGWLWTHWQTDHAPFFGDKSQHYVLRGTEVIFRIAAQDNSELRAAVSGEKVVAIVDKRVVKKAKELKFEHALRVFR